ncbi:MAG: hypothetical protein PF541_18325 [Prolixibacteraceae bacterium]|jgi:predicted NodU family carbamoyl transferase|nr:hypothetical protein [Prolixibacteraceae bacterium]
MLIAIKNFAELIILVIIFRKVKTVSAFFTSSFQEAVILTIDGVGERATPSIYKGSVNKIEILKELHFPHSLGLLYFIFTYFLGFKVNSGEFKLMGLATYRDPDKENVKRYIESIKLVLLMQNVEQREGFVKVKCQILLFYKALIILIVSLNL